MKKQVSPVVAVVLIALVAVVGAALIWRGTSKTVNLPAKPPSGPIVLPPSQQGRRTLHRAYSGQQQVPPGR